ncbi:hypothetical protein [Micromonospora sp. LOL_021]|uniref:hypothetical protein n=1 Tax=Micromonospora sp. LOL_021 TaxID=3345417 RepID=UPI003A835806
MYLQVVQKSGTAADDGRVQVGEEAVRVVAVAVTNAQASEVDDWFESEAGRVAVQQGSVEVDARVAAAPGAGKTGVAAVGGGEGRSVEHHGRLVRIALAVCGLGEPDESVYPSVQWFGGRSFVGNEVRPGRA